MKIPLIGPPQGDVDLGAWRSKEGENKVAELVKGRICRICPQTHTSNGRVVDVDAHAPRCYDTRDPKGHSKPYTLFAASVTAYDGRVAFTSDPLPSLIRVPPHGEHTYRQHVLLETRTPQAEKKFSEDARHLLCEFVLWAWHSLIAGQVETQGMILMHSRAIGDTCKLALCFAYMSPASRVVSDSRAGTTMIDNISRPASPLLLQHPVYDENHHDFLNLVLTEGCDQQPGETDADYAMRYHAACEKLVRSYADKQARRLRQEVP